jgi:sec-independent protein translocase protein TatB
MGEGFMILGPNLLVILAIAFIVIGPKKLPEIAKTLGKALAEFKKTTEEIKDSIGINELGGISSSLTNMDQLADFAEKVSSSMSPKEETDQTTVPEKNSVSLPEAPEKPAVNGEKTGKRENEGWTEVKDKIPG